MLPFAPPRVPEMLIRQCMPSELRMWSEEMDPPEVAGLRLLVGIYARECKQSRDCCGTQCGAPHLKRSLHLGPLGAAELCVLRAAHRDEPARNQCTLPPTISLSRDGPSDTEEQWRAWFGLSFKCSLEILV